MALKQADGKEIKKKRKKERDSEPRIPYPGQGLRREDMEGLNRNSTDREEGNRGEEEEVELGHVSCQILPEGLPEAEPGHCSVTADLKSGLSSLSV